MSTSALPERTIVYLRGGAQKGNRNDELLHAACQFRDARYSESEAIEQLVPRARTDGLSSQEARAAIHSAFSRGARKQIGPIKHNGTDSSSPHYRQVNVEPAPLPKPVEQSAITFLETVFREGEFIGIAEAIESRNGEISVAPNAGRVRTRETWIAHIALQGMDAVFEKTDGLFVRINPLRNANGKADKDVAAYRHVLIESDEGTKEEQLGALRGIGLPISVITDSGNRSLHALVVVNAPDEATYRERFEILRKFCIEALGLEVDEKNKNPSRFSRMPGVKRARRDHETNERILGKDGQPIFDNQTLLEKNLPGKPWDEWVENLPVDGEEPQKKWDECLRGGMCSSEELSTMDIAPPKPILGDWLREGDLGFIFAQRGIGKTWLALDMAHGIAEKKNVGPWEVYLQEKCLYLDGEMPPGDIKKRDHALGQASKNLIYINHEILFERTGRVMNLADADFQKAILDLCISEGFKILFLDNLSCLASGVDENKSMDWEILLPWLLRLLRAHITVIFIAHAGRNNQMRGHSKREDPAFWIMRLDAPLDVIEGVMGAHFITRFTKWRSVQKPATYQWSYKPVGNNGEDLCVEFKTANPIDIFRHLVESGMDTATHIAEEMEVSIGYISQLATRGKKEGWLDITNRRYHLTDT